MPFLSARLWFTSSTLVCVCVCVLESCPEHFSASVVYYLCVCVCMCVSLYTTVLSIHMDAYTHTQSCITTLYTLHTHNCSHTYSYTDILNTHTDVKSPASVSDNLAPCDTCTVLCVCWILTVITHPQLHFCLSNNILI